MSGFRSKTETQNAEDVCSQTPRKLFAEVFTDHVLVYDACLPPHAQPVSNSLNVVINHQLLILSVCQARHGLTVMDFRESQWAETLSTSHACWLCSLFLHYDLN